MALNDIQLTAFSPQAANSTASRGQTGDINEWSMLALILSKLVYALFLDTGMVFTFTKNYAFSHFPDTFNIIGLSFVSLSILYTCPREKQYCSTIRKQKYKNNDKWWLSHLSLSVKWNIGSGGGCSELDRTHLSRCGKRKTHPSPSTLASLACRPIVCCRIFWVSWAIGTSHFQIETPILHLLALVDLQ